MSSVPFQVRQTVVQKEPVRDLRGLGFFAATVLINSLLLLLDVEIASSEKVLSPQDGTDLNTNEAIDTLPNYLAAIGLVLNSVFTFVARRFYSTTRFYFLALGAIVLSSLAYLLIPLVW